MTKRILSIMLTLCLILTLVPSGVAGVSGAGAAEAYAASEPTDAELEKVFANLGFAGRMVGSNAEFEDDENIYPSMAYWFMYSNGILEKYYNPDAGCFELSIDQYMDEMDKAFTNYSEDAVVAYLEETGCYDSIVSDRVEIYSGGVGGYWTWEPLEITKKNNTYKIEGLYLVGSEETGDVEEDDVEFYDYWLYTVEPIEPDGTSYTYKTEIVKGIIITVENTSEGLKVSSYDETPYYTWDGVTYCQNEQTGEFDQSYTVKLGYTTATYSGSYKKPSVTVTDKDGNVLDSSKYEVEYENNKNPGTAKVEIEVDYDDYECDIVKTFKIKLKAPSVKATNIASSGKIKLTWNEVNKADKYYVYRASSKKGTYERIKTTTATSYTDTSAKAEKTYYYKVKAVYSADSTYNSSYSSIVTRTCDLQKVVRLIVDNVGTTGKPQLFWTGVSNGDKYEVYRATSKNGTYKRVKTISGHAWNDNTAVAEKTYYYKVRAISSSNSSANGAFSSKVSKVCDLATPVISVSRNSSGAPKVTWKKISYADKYYVYRATSKSGTYKRVKTTTNRYYTDTTAKAGKTYYYKVKAISRKTSDANSQFSTIKSCKAK